MLDEVGDDPLRRRLRDRTEDERTRVRTRRGPWWCLWLTVPSCRLAASSQHGPAIARRNMLQARSLASVFWLTLQNLLAAILLVAIPAVLAHSVDAGGSRTARDFARVFWSRDAVHGARHRSRHYPATGDRRDISLDRLRRERRDRRHLRGAVDAGAPAITAWLRMDLRLIGILRWLGVTLIPLSTAIVSRNLLATTAVVSPRHDGRRRSPARRRQSPRSMVFSRGLDVALTRRISRLRHGRHAWCCGRPFAGGRRRARISAWSGRCCVSVCRCRPRRCWTTCRCRATGF